MSARSRTASSSSAVFSAVPGGTRTAGIFFMLVNTLTWGAALPICKFAVVSTSSFHFLLYRFGLAALLSAPILFFLWKKVRPNFRDIAGIVLLELLGTTVGLALLYRGLTLTSSLEASLLTLTIPVFVTLGGILFLKETQEKNEWMGLFFALAGTLLLTFETLLSGRSDSRIFTSLEGNVLVMISNILVAAYYLLAKRRYAKYPKFFVTGISFWVGTVSFLVFCLVLSGLNPTVLAHQIQTDFTTAGVLWPSLYMAIFGSILGLTAYIKGQNLLEASEASLFTYLQPVVTLPLAFLLHAESPNFLMIIALGVVIVGVALAELRVSKARDRGRSRASKKRSALKR